MAAQSGEVLPDRQLRRRQPAARPAHRHGAGRRRRTNALTVGPPGLPGLRRGAGRPVRARRRDAGHRRPHGDGQRDRVPGGLQHARTRRARGGSPWLHSLFGNAPAVAAGRRRRAEGQGPQRRPGRRPGRRRRHGRHRVRLPVGHVRAQRRRAVRLLRQPGLHEHGRAALRRHPAGRPHRHHPGGRRRSRATSFGQGKSAPLIAMAHEIPYVATATVADLRDLEAKVTRAMQLRGARYLHVLVPCPLGWGSAAARHHPGRPARHRERLLPGLRGGARRGRRGQPDPAAGSGRRVPAAAGPLRPPVPPDARGPTSSRRSRTAPTATSARFGLLDTEES